MENLCLIDTVFFSGANIQPSVATFTVRWDACGPAEKRGLGLDAPGGEFDKAAFLGEFAPAISTGLFSCVETGFSFRSEGRARSDLEAPLTGYADMGWEKNGKFLLDST